MKKLLLRILRDYGGRTLAREINRLLRKLTGFTHRLQFVLEWGGGLPANWFDHNLDLYHLWHKTRNPMGWERGIFGLLAMRQGAQVLELCCGDGFYSYYFYSIRAGNVLAVDIDQDAIRSARRNFSAPNVEYAAADILARMPEGKFDNIVWDGALEYFRPDEITLILQNIKSRLAENGILSGHVILQQQCNEGQKYAFSSREDLLRFLQPHFPNIRMFETRYPARHNLYFYASAAGLPFDQAWPSQTALHGDALD